MIYKLVAQAEAEIINRALCADVEENERLCKMKTFLKVKLIDEKLFQIPRQYMFDS